MKRALPLLCLLLLLGVSHADAKRYPLDRSFTVSVPLHTGLSSAAPSSPSVTLRFNVDDPSSLEVRVGRVTQRFKPDPVGTEFPSGGLIWEDFNFDGYNDLGVPDGIGYAGVNTFYAVYTYRPVTGRFERLNFPGGSTPNLCNPVPEARTRTISSECKSGPAYYRETFRVQGSLPYRSSATELAVLKGFDGLSASVWVTTAFDAKERMLSAAVTEFESDRPALRFLPIPKAYLHTAPNAAARTTSYIVRGDAIRILNVLETPRGQWLQIAYQSRKLGRIVRWINLG